jgi:hypothetical protein
MGRRVPLSAVRRAVVGVLLSLGLLLLAMPAAIAFGAPTTTQPQPSGSGITSGGEGFPWVAVGVVALAAGGIGWQLRRAARG